MRHFLALLLASTLAMATLATLEEVARCLDNLLERDVAFWSKVQASEQPRSQALLSLYQEKVVNPSMTRDSNTTVTNFKGGDSNSTTVNSSQNKHDLRQLFLKNETTTKLPPLRKLAKRDLPAIYQRDQVKLQS